MSRRAALLRYSFLFISTAIVVDATWKLASGHWPPFGAAFLGCVLVYAYDRLVVRRSFDR